LNLNAMYVLIGTGCGHISVHDRICVPTDTSWILHNLRDPDEEMSWRF